MSNTMYRLINYSATFAFQFSVGTAEFTNKHDNISPLHKSNSLFTYNKRDIENTAVMFTLETYLKTFIAEEIPKLLFVCFLSTFLMNVGSFCRL